MSQSSGSTSWTPVRPAADFDRPLLLTPGQDLAGYAVARAGRLLLLLITLTSVAAVGLIFAFIILKSYQFFATRGVWELLATQAWEPTHEDPRFGALRIIVGSVYVTVGAMVIAVPVGLLAAVCLSDIVSFRVRQIVKPVIEILAAIPSVAFGFFAYLVVAPWMQTTLGFTWGTNALNASVILAFMAMPTIVSISEDALTAAGRELREASYAVGATRAETLIKVVIPAAHSGIIAAIILGVMRAVGETMLVWMAAGNALNIPSPWWDLSQQVRALTATIAAEMGEAPQGGIHRQALFALGLILLVMTFALNLVSDYFLARTKRVGRAASR